MAVTVALILLIWWRALTASLRNRVRVMMMWEADSITDHRLLVQSMAVLGVVVVAFGMTRSLHLESGTIALGGAALHLLLYTFGHRAEGQAVRVQEIFAEVDWTTIFFFVGLFVVIQGVAANGLLVRCR